jgi:carbon-monoxide dehydrogenase medium subunit
MAGSPDIDWYQAPTDLADAIDAVAAGARVLAGGTDLVAAMNLHGLRPERVVWIGRLGLDRVQRENDVIRIGAATTLADLAAAPTVRSSATSLAEAAGKVAGPAVRNLATLGGSLCAAWPRSDVGCAALGLDATVEVVGRRGVRSIPMRDFYAPGAGVAVATDEIVVELRVPTASRSAFAKIGRRSSMTLAVVNAAVRVELDETGRIAQAVVAVGAGPMPQRAPSVESELIGQLPDPDVVGTASSRVADDVEFADDEHASSWYRARVAPVVVDRAVTAAIRSEGSP